MAKVYTSSVVNAPAAKVWARVRDFNGLPGWHPAIGESRIENDEPADKVGCIRDFRLQKRRPHPRAAAGRCRITTCSAPTRSWNRPWEWRTTSQRSGSRPVTDGHAHLPGVDRRVRLRARARGGAGFQHRHRRVPGRLRCAQAPVRRLSRPWSAWSKATIIDAPVDRGVGNLARLQRLRPLASCSEDEHHRAPSAVRSHRLRAPFPAA